MSKTITAMFLLLLMIGFTGCRRGGGDGGNATVGQGEDEVIEFTNKEREKKGLPALKKNDELMLAARKHALSMASHDDLSHNLGGDPGKRIKAAGYNWKACGENIAWNYSNAETVVSGWMNSSGHRRNILSTNFTEIGVGVALNEKGEPYYCQCFGRR